ncbi:uncharacterized protein LOC126750472 isoform X1 [Anthonomus grandis grandis]|uniref:uncharacterized protein LOC126750472 isoform X1 n=1 Tax=Anthonomus grandis grandis TaxID=2921223 RepID=UPI0021667B66|nr:uncharacterized protein LOC126750472 isoform X1 [Anthonomus grandis grandis]
MKPVVKFLRSNGIVCVIYLDDILIISKTFETACKDCQATKDLLESLGFLLNSKKSNLVPSQTCTFLGFAYNSISFKVLLPIEKATLIQAQILKLLTKDKCSILTLAQLIGKFVAACPAVKYGWVHLKILERKKYLALRSNRHNYQSTLLLSDCIKSELQWWHQTLTHNYGTHIVTNTVFALEIFTDASLTGWGAHCLSKVTHGFWHTCDRVKHINYLELLAAFNALRSFASDLSNCSILLGVDNVTAIACINRMGSVRFKNLNYITRQIWLWCETRNIFLVASYVNTKDNVHADKESRSTYTEYELSNHAFQKICQYFGKPTIDLFASQLNAKCTRYISWKPDPSSITVDAFTVSWEGQFFYAFPPFSLVLKCLQKIIAEGAQGIVVVPRWNTQPWYSTFCKLLVTKPLVFTPDQSLLSSPFRDPLWQTLSLEVEILSGRLFTDEVSQQ